MKKQTIKGKHMQSARKKTRRLSAKYHLICSLILMLGFILEPFHGQNLQANTSNISIEQAISDQAQLKTIAFSSLAFQTGDVCSSTFFPPGKVSDFFGFQYLRDTTINGFGHNTEFAGKISDSVLSLLTDSQVQALVDMANTQAAQVDAYG